MRMGWIDGMDEWEERERDRRKRKKKNATESYGCVPCHAERRHAMKKKCIL
jgi:hypothetical protein